MDAKRELRLNIFSLFKKGEVREAQKMFEKMVWIILKSQMKINGIGYISF